MRHSARRRPLSLWSHCRAHLIPEAMPCQMWQPSRLSFGRAKHHKPDPQTIFNEKLKPSWRPAAAPHVKDLTFASPGATTEDMFFAFLLKLTEARIYADKVVEDGGGH